MIKKISYQFSNNFSSLNKNDSRYDQVKSKTEFPLPFSK